MPELYIIGNGFDKEHGLKTFYWNFENTLKSMRKMGRDDDVGLYWGADF